MYFAHSLLGKSMKIKLFVTDAKESINLQGKQFQHLLEHFRLLLIMNQMTKR